MTAVDLDRWMVDGLGLVADDNGQVALTDATTGVLAAAFRTDRRKLTAIVRSLVEEQVPQAAFAMRTGGWRIDVEAAVARSLTTGVLSAVALQQVGERSLPVVALSAIAAALFSVERVEVTPSDLVIHAELVRSGQGQGEPSLAGLHAQLPRHIRREVSVAQLADVVDRLGDAGLAGWDDRGLVIRDPKTVRLVLDHDRSDAVLGQLVSELHPAGVAERDDLVFVVHGRDMAFRQRFFDLLRALGLTPLEWEPLVAETGSTLPHLLDVVDVGLSLARVRAAIVLMTPDDIVWLHPDHRGRSEDGHELSPMLQARPNVLVELGLALAAFPETTILVGAGRLRPIGDLAGLNEIRFDGSPDKIRKVASRLKAAGCAVDDGGSDWLAVDRFADLATFDRQVPRAVEDLGPPST